jgi:imidazoleglycerol-phosphate dehydratase
MSETASRRAEKHRVTRETDVRVLLDIDGSGQSEIATGVPFLDHMLTSFARHGRFNLTIAATGDLAVDDHHTVEDVGLVLGDVWREALGDMRGIARFGSAYVPMDDALARVVVDCSGRPFLVWAVDVPTARIGSFDPALAEEFWRAVSTRAGLTLHIDLLRQRNAHHGLEAIWKAAGMALKEASRIAYPGEVQSTKGVLE